MIAIKESISTEGTINGPPGALHSCNMHTGLQALYTTELTYSNFAS